MTSARSTTRPVRPRARRLARRAAPAERPSVGALAADLTERRQHYEALVADARSDLEVLSVYLDAVHNAPNLANVNNPEWSSWLETMEKLEGA